jgi:glycosyltransferase involved in cell wall biosynthesis
MKKLLVNTYNLVILNFEETMKTLKVAIVIPAFNESNAISNVINEISNYGKAIVVDDGSTDNTAQLAFSAGALVVTHIKNYGYDSAIASGLGRAITEGFDIAITLDADGQHIPSHINNILLELHNGADLVVGVRDKFQRVSETIFARISNFLWSIQDPLCGMKGYNLSKIKFIKKLSTYSSIGTELTIRAARSGWVIRQIPITTREREGKSRFGSGLYSNWLIFRAMIFGILFASSINIIGK